MNQLETRLDNIIYRRATLADKNVLLNLEQKVVEAERPFNSIIKSVGATYYDLDSLLTQENSMLMVAVDGNSIIATGYVQIRASKKSLKHIEHGYIGFMYVAAEYRGLGLNKLIMDELIHWSTKRGVFDFYLDVYAKNDAAIKAYKKVGFEASMVEMKLHIPAE
ncbi:GNAT family N-acetyltransferase [Shewanella sp. KT0246]|uniref:GNAT family N-acetyltransferase n=1 Tax=Shewanella sp. KT0246 TaxID=2815912 RepID=UPI001BBCE8D1|nr:GNAT family N-acetyltransferase [Shewanella sp. KT0246]GIU53069.1 N-acetyltransferase [Shewanella sp. KT0246]